MRGSPEPGPASAVGPPAVHLPTAAILAAALEAAPEAVLVCAADDTVRFVNRAARRLLPTLAPGDRTTAAALDGLARAAGGRVDSFVDEHQGRRVYGRRRPLSGGETVWYLREAAAPLQPSAEPAHALLADLGRRLSGSLNQRSTQYVIAELAVAHLADAAAVLTGPLELSPATTWVRLVAGGRVTGLPADPDQFSQIPGLLDTATTYPPLPSRRLDPVSAPGWLLPAEAGPVGELLLVALPGGAGPAGAMVLARRADRPAFSDEEEALARTFAARAGAALAAAVTHRVQAEAMAVLEAELLPPRLPALAGVELAGSYRPADDALRVGGDFYDVFLTDETGPAVVVLGDVCGKGAEAAALTGKVRHTLRALHLVEPRPAALVDVLNRALLLGGGTGRFVTLVVGSLTFAAPGPVRLDFATGGHPAPLVLREDGSVAKVPVAGALVGVLPEPTIGTASVELAPGELCLLYSDGLTDARGGARGTEQFGRTRLRQALQTCQGMPATAVVERLSQLVSDWSSGQVRDDIAVLAIQTRPRRAERRR